MAALGEKSFCVFKYQSMQRTPPTHKTIRAWYKQFTETGCLCKQKSSGRPLTAEDDVEWVWASFLHSLNKSMRTAAKEL
jgi:transposase